MKKIIITVIVILSTVSVYAQTPMAERIYRNARRTAEREIEYAINREIRATINEMSRQASKARRQSELRLIWNCPNCHCQNRGNFCTHCGEPKPLELVPWQCPNCKHGNDGGLYCEKCGHSRIHEGTHQNTMAITLEELSQLHY